MDFYRHYSLHLSGLVLVLVIVILVSTSGSVFSSGVALDSTLHRSSGDEVYVRTTMDFGDAEQVNSFPTEIGDWTGLDYETGEIRESLGADAVLLRNYVRPGIYLGVDFLILQAETESSFHPPPVCYSAIGFEIEEEGEERVLIEGPEWAEAASKSISIPVDKVVVQRKSGERIRERRLALYFYVKGNQFTSDAITLIRVEAQAPVDAPYDGILGVEKEFIAQAVPHMFEPGDGDGGTTVAGRLARSGFGGYLLIILLLLVPVAIAVYPRTRWGRAQAGEETPRE